MLKFLFDTDHLTHFDHFHPLVTRNLASHAPGAVGLPVVVIEEYLRGRLARIAQAKDGSARISRYALLLNSLQVLQQFPNVPFEQAAEVEYQKLRAMRLRAGSRDQKIAAIALANNLIVVTSNRRDFGQIPGLVLEDWSV